VARGCSLNEDDAADVSQTTWTRLAERLESIREPARLGAWLATTARRESLRILRYQQRHVGVETCSDALFGADDPTIGQILEREREDELWHALESLPGPCKALLRAMFADPAPTYAEISSAFHMPIGSIGPTRARCLERLRCQVEEATARDVPTSGRASPPTVAPAGSPRRVAPVTVSFRRRVS
jgi:RNA polymerase sigma factor (sigma-70 family)